MPAGGSSTIFTAGNFRYTPTLMALLRSVATVGSYTLVSRIFGFLRDILTAALLGAGPVADAFFVALRLPNLFRSLFAEGAFSAAFVPFFAGNVAQSGKASARVFAEDVLAVLLVALLGFVLLGEIFMPSVMAAVAPGFSREPDKFRLAVDLARINFPYLLFIALVALQGGVLNSLDRFAAPAATPILLNLLLIAALWMSKRFGWHDGHALAWAVCAAGFAQFLWLMFCCNRAQVGLRLPMPRLTAEVRRTLRVMAPGVFGAGVTQLNLLISTMLASFLAGGSVSFLYYADRLNQLPLGVVGIAVGTAILPPLSRQLRQGDRGAAIATQNRGLELALLLTLPAAVALAVLAVPILTVLFQRGAFSSGRHRGDGDGARRLCRRPAGVCSGQGSGPGVFRPARHQDTGQARGCRSAGQSVADLDPDAALGACRDRARHECRRLGQRARPPRPVGRGAVNSGSTGGRGAICRGSGRRRSAWAARFVCCCSPPRRLWVPPPPGGSACSPASSSSGSRHSPSPSSPSASPIGVFCSGGNAGNRLDRNPAPRIRGTPHLPIRTR